jgi:ABC-type transport system involved in cytochrome bd biosynthesis fused ATPase/permease subunit
MDEPTLGLDAAAVQELATNLRAATRRGPVVVITHDERLLAEADRTYETRRIGARWELFESTSKATPQILSA